MSGGKIPEGGVAVGGGAGGSTGVAGGGAGVAAGGGTGLGCGLGFGDGTTSGPKSEGRAPWTRGTSTVPTPMAARSSSVSWGARTMWGVSEIRISLSDPVWVRLVKSLLMIGTLCRPKMPVKESCSLSWRRPPMRLVSPSRTRSVPLTFRVRNVGSSCPPSAEGAPGRLNSAFSSSVMSPEAATRGVMSRLTPTLRYWKEVAGENVPAPPVAVAWKVVTGTGTSWPILSVAFLPSAARRRGEARILVLVSDWRNFANRLFGRLTTKSARLIEERRWARTFVKTSLPLVVTSPSAPVGTNVSPAE